MSSRSSLKFSTFANNSDNADSCATYYYSASGIRSFTQKYCNYEDTHGPSNHLYALIGVENIKMNLSNCCFIRTTEFKNIFTAFDNSNIIVERCFLDGNKVTVGNVRFNNLIESSSLVKIKHLDTYYCKAVNPKIEETVDINTDKTCSKCAMYVAVVYD